MHILNSSNTKVDFDIGATIIWILALRSYLGVGLGALSVSSSWIVVHDHSFDSLDWWMIEFGVLDLILLKRNKFTATRR